MSRTAVFLAALALLVISTLPISRALVTAVVVDDSPNAEWVLTARHLEEAFGSGTAADEGTAPVPDNGAPRRQAGARLRMLGNSVAIGLVAALLAMLIGVPFALLIGRTDAPLRGVLGWAYLVPLVLPPLLVAVAWNFIPALAPPKLTAAREPSAWGGLVAVLRAGSLFALCYFPLVVLFARRAMKRVPAALEESARLAAGPWRTLRSITLPTALPGILAGGVFVFVFALNDFAVVDFLNWVRPTSDQVSVYPFESFTAWSKSQGPGVATALGLPLVLLGTGMLFVLHRLLGNRSRAAVSGDFRPPQPWTLGSWRWPATALACTLLVVAVAVPVGALVWKAGSIDSYRTVWSRVAGASSSTHEAEWTLWFAFGSALVALPLAFVLGHHAARTRRAWPLILALLPLTLPPIFLGAGYLRLANDPVFAEVLGHNPLLDPDSPRWGAVLLLVAKYIPFAIAALWAAFVEVDPRLEEAAASAGARPLARILAITEPLVRPASALAFVLVFVFALREIDTIVLITADSVMRRIYTMIHFQRDDQVAALCVLLIVLQVVPLLVLAILAPRRETAAAA